jgi:hypothetical protein
MLKIALFAVHQNLNKDEQGTLEHYCSLLLCYWRLQKTRSVDMVQITTVCWHTKQPITTKQHLHLSLLETLSSH